MMGLGYHEELKNNALEPAPTGDEVVTSGIKRRSKERIGA